MDSTDPQITRAEIRRMFARAIFTKVSALQTLPLTHRESARIAESIASDIRKACDLLASVEVSEAAREQAVLLGVDLCVQGWHDQPKFDPGRSTFHLEHVQPVGVICREVSAQSSVEDVFEVLGRGLRLAWILKSEDRELTRLGYRSKRVDPDAAYLAAGIKLRTG